MREPGERIGLAFDATMLALDAVKERVSRMRGGEIGPWDPDSIDSVQVADEIHIRNEHRRSNSGYADFVSGDRVFMAPGRGEPYNQRISLLYVPSARNPYPPAREIVYCVQHGPNLEQTTRCTAVEDVP